MSDPDMPNLERLLDGLESRLGSGDQAELEAALATDHELARTTLWFADFRARARGIVLHDPPPTVAGYLDDLYAGFMALKRDGKHRVLIARASVDSARRPVGAGARSAAMGTGSRHLHYTTDVADIAIDVHRRSDPAIDVQGQVFPIPAMRRADWNVQLLRGSEEVGSRAATDLGEFTFTGLVQGDYRMFLTTGSLGILVTPVPLVLP